MENDDEPISSTSLQVQTSGLDVDDFRDSNGDGDEDISPFDTSTMVAQKPKTRRPVINPIHEVNRKPMSRSDSVKIQNLDIASRIHRFRMYA